MGLETATYINELNAANPAIGDNVSVGDDHIRLVKSTIKNTFPNITGAVTPTHTELNYVDGVTSAIQTQLDAKSSLAIANIFSTILSTTTAPIQLESNQPGWLLKELDAAVDNKYWRFYLSAERLRFDLLNDAGDTAADWLTVDRTGNVADLVQILASELDVLGSIEATAASPNLSLKASGAAVDNKSWSFRLQSDGDLELRTRDDAGALGATPLLINRTGAVVDSITLAATDIILNGTVALNSPNPNAKVKTVTTSRANTTTLADDPHLTGLSLLADTWYKFKLFLSIFATGGSSGIKFKLNFSNAPQNCFCLIVGTNAQQGNSNFNSSTVNLDSVIAASYSFMVIEGTIRSNATTGGTVALHWAQLQSDAANTEVRLGSRMELERVT